MLEDEKLENLRLEIYGIDKQLIDLISRRLAVARSIGEVKKKSGMAILQAGREQEVIEKRRALAISAGIDSGLVERLFRELMAASRKAQE